ncbi:MAG: SprB repeat-containing protein, partial [Flavobacteriales bacterium]
VHADSGSGLYHYYVEIYNSSGWQSVGQVPAPGQYTTIDTISFTNLPADTFRVILEDSANQCFDTIGFPIINLFVFEPTQIIISESVINATNVLTLDGSATLSVSGGGPSYTFSWIGPNGFLSSSQNINNLQYGIYNYTLTDTNGCIITDSVYVAASQACSFGSFTSAPPICFGDGNGQILINSVFGSPQFTYLLEYQNPNTLNWNFVNSAIVVDSFYTFTNLYSGTYQYILTDASGCSVTSPQINVQDPTPISSNNTIIFTSSSTSCDGQISSIINGGVAPIIHNWIGPNSFNSNLPIIINLCVGTYCDSVVDANGCNAILCDFVNFEPPCSPEVEINNIFCDEDSSGLAIVTKTNNAYPLFVWIHDFTGDTISMDTFAVNLPSGNYTFNAYNLGVPGACPDTSIYFTILAPDLTLMPISGNTICTGDSTFFIVDPVNIDSNYLYQINIGNNSFLLEDSSLYYPVGIYTYTVEIDTGNGFVPCFSSQNIEVIENDLNIDAILVINEICATYLGSVEVFASSSFSPINFSLDTNYQSSNLFTNLSSAYYNLSVQDGMNCTILQDSILVDLESSIVLNVDSALETCRLNDGWIEVIAQNGYGGYQYSIDSGLSFSSTIYSDTLLIDSLVKGYYNLVVRDDSMCVYDYGNIYIGKTPRPKIDYIHMKNESCCGWDGEITIFSTPQNTISIYSLDTFNTFQNSNLFDSLMSGDYLIYIEDTNSCLDSIEVTLEADSTPNINLTVGITDVVCNGDSNGTFKIYYPDSCYIYELHRYTFFTPTLVLDTGDYFNELISGFYGVIAISNSGTCFDSSAVKFIDEPIPISFDPPVITDVRCLNNDSCNGEIYLPTDPTGGVSPYYYYLKDVNNNIPMGVLPCLQKFEYLCPSEYEIQIVDGNACVVYDTIFVADSSLYIDSFSVQNVQCYNGNDGVVEVFVSGGLGNYSYLWSNSDTTNIADSLSGHEYFILVTDSVGCFAFDSVQISDPDTLQFDILGKKDETCMGVTNDGEIYLAFYGGTSPYNFMWSSFSGFSGNSGFGFGDTIFNLTYDTIIIDVTDANYCSASPVWVTQSVTIVDALNSSNLLSFDSIYLFENPICFGTHTAFIDIDLNGGDAPIQYSIDSMNSWSALDSFAHLNAGKYNIYVQDTYGCLDSAIVNIIEYDQIIINYDSIKQVSCFEGNDGYISVSNSGGVTPYSYLWIPTNETTNQISDLYAVPHIIKVTDSVNCVIVDTIDLYELTEPIQTISSVVNIISCFEGN